MNSPKIAVDRPWTGPSRPGKIGTFIYFLITPLIFSSAKRFSYNLYGCHFSHLFGQVHVQLSMSHGGSHWFKSSTAYQRIQGGYGAAAP